MEIDLIFKIAAIGIIVAVLNQLLIRSGREDQAMMTTLAGLVVVLSILVKQISVRYHQVAVCTMSAAVAVFGIALLAALLYAVLEKQAPAYALLLSLGAALVLLVRAGTSIRAVLSGIARLAGQADSGAFSCLVRSAAIVLLTDYTRTLCEEAGAESLGWCVGLAGRCLVLAAAWPLLEEILQTIGSIAR